MQFPEDLRYTTNHEWVRDEGDGSYRVGITDFAQDSLGDIVYVALPDVGRSLGRGDPFGEVESTKSVSDVYSPVSGTVTEVNEALVDAPEAINQDPYGNGWIAVISSDEGLAADLLDAAGYRDIAST